MDRGFSRPVANGLKTDHPIPDLPFVDDSHIPVEDPLAIEAIGRHEGGEMWGREDTCRDGGWTAFTTDPGRHDLAWVVRWHPEHGRSVVLYRNEDAAGVHTELQDTALLFRSGGYWWDGTTWYRPRQIWDGASQDYLRRPVPAATTITAADLLAGAGDPDRAAVLNVQDVDLDAPTPIAEWVDHLALWARVEDVVGSDLEDSVVRLTAPELSGDQLVGMAELAVAAGVAPSTLRAYIARDESDVPAPQATISGRSVWSRAVAAEWAERRRAQDLDGTIGAARPGPAGQLPPGREEVRVWFGRLFFDRLWRNPERRRRWALRARNEAAVQEVAGDLALDVAANLRQIIRLGDLAITIRQAVLADFRTSEDLHREVLDTGDRPGSYAISLPVGRMLGWLIRHDPDLARHTIDQIVGEAERELRIARADSAQAVRVSVGMDGGLDDADAETFLEQVLNPLLEGAGPPTGRPAARPGPDTGHRR